MQQDPDQQRNLLLAVILSKAVLLGWQLFYAGPKLRDEQARLKAQQELTQQPGSSKEAPKPAAPSSATPGAAPAASTASEDAIKTSPRLTIDTPSMKPFTRRQNEGFHSPAS